VVGDIGADGAGFLVVAAGCGAGLASLAAGGSMTEIAGGLTAGTAAGGVFGRHTEGGAAVDAACACALECAPAIIHVTLITTAQKAAAPPTALTFLVLLHGGNHGGDACGRGSAGDATGLDVVRSGGGPAGAGGGVRTGTPSPNVSGGANAIGRPFTTS